MIDVLLEPYEDELFYSWLARSYVKNCYPDYKTFSFQVMGRRDTNPSFDFINKIEDDEQENIKKIFKGGIKQIIGKHTLIPYYASCIKSEKRQYVYANAGTVNLPFDKLLSLPNLQHTKYLKYCPLCAKEDRKKYGETYWHRKHQIIDVSVCYLHKVKLIETDIATNEKVRWNLYAAEMEIPEKSVIEEATESEIKKASYTAELLELASDISVNDTVTAGRYLSLRMIGTKYVTVRGNKRHIAMLNKDLNDYWGREVPLYKIKKVLRGLTNQINEIVAIAIFLDVSPKELLLKENASNEHIIEFDNKVIEMYRDGKTVNAIAYAMQLSPLTVRNIIKKDCN